MALRSPSPSRDPRSKPPGRRTLHRAGARRRGHGHAGPRRLLGAVLASAFVVTAGLVALVERPAEARYATGGVGLYKGLIDWPEWGTRAGEILVSPAVATSPPRQVGSKQLVTTCTARNFVANSISAYTPGDWIHDGLDDLYNVGGTDKSNALRTGIRTQFPGQATAFDIECSAVLRDTSTTPPTDTPIAINGLVVADAETSNLGGGEWIEATPSSTAVWRVIERHRNSNCSLSTRATLAANGTTMTFAPMSVSECSGSGPMAVGFMQGATSARIRLRGGGISAVAVGVMLSADFGDAPASYGEAGAVFQPGWTGGVVAPGTQQDVFASNFVLATPTQPTARLGAIIDSEAVQLTSTDASGDDLNSLDDEDVPFPTSLDAFPGGTVTVPGIPCTGPGYVQGWIDWNRNGLFDPSDAAGTVTGGIFTASPVLCAAGGTARSVNLTFKVPSDAARGATFARLRISPTSANAAQPTGMMIGGEVEDHQVTLALAPLRVVKTSNATRDTRPGDVITYTVEVTNIGTGTLTSALTATIVDDLGAVVDDATYNTDARDNLVNPPTPSQFVLANNQLTWTFVTPEQGRSATMTYSVTIKQGGDRVVRNVAWAQDTGSTGVPACDQTGGVPDDPATGQACGVTSFDLPYLTVSKSSNATEATRAGDHIAYTVTATNSGPGDFTSAAPAVVMDDLTGLIDDATYVDGTAGANRPGTVDAVGPVLSWTGALASRESVALTYSVLLTNGGDGLGRNVAWVPHGVPPGGTPSTPPCSASPDPVTGEECALAIQGVPRLAVSKKVDGATDLRPGSVLDYTVTIRNTGTA
ncbi:MAG: CshA/CshB family fibrillar adhesin-related protein, partial [Bifidobacteriaceae bacterium]|nr:CshA/CshB family fibrillar adhesin-related protein [Bifidobacteriaceae bacterium]